MNNSDEIAWLFNLRGWGDVAFCPVLVAYALITVTAPAAPRPTPAGAATSAAVSTAGGGSAADVPAGTATLFVDERKLDAATRSHLEAAGVRLAPYASIEAAVQELVEASAPAPAPATASASAA